MYVLVPCIRYVIGRMFIVVFMIPLLILIDDEECDFKMAGFNVCGTCIYNHISGSEN